MAKYISIVSGVKTEIQPVNVSAGAGDANKMIQLDAAGKLDTTFMPSGFGSEDYSMTAAETIAAGDLIHITAAGEIEKADATNSAKPAMGYAQAGIAAAAVGTVRLGNGVLTGLTGLTPGASYYLLATAGTFGTTAPAATGNIVQPVGFAKSATEFAYIDTRDITVLV